MIVGFVLDLYDAIFVLVVVRVSWNWLVMLLTRVGCWT